MKKSFRNYSVDERPLKKQNFKKKKSGDKNLRNMFLQIKRGESAENEEILT